jgi:hypothetical protein
MITGVTKMVLKIRHKHWYWGKFILNGTVMDSTRFTINSQDFEEYIEEIHGWHLSEEFRNEQENLDELQMQKTK